MAGFKLRWAGFVAMATLLLAPTRAQAHGGGLEPGLPPQLFKDCGGPLPPIPGGHGKRWPERTRGVNFTPQGLAVLEQLSANPELTAKLRVPGGRKGELVVDMRGTLTDRESGARTWVGELPVGDGGELVLSSHPGPGVGPGPLEKPGRSWYGSLRSDTHGTFEIRAFAGLDCAVFVRPNDEPPRCGLVPRPSGRNPPPRILPIDRTPLRGPPVVELLVLASPVAAEEIGGAAALKDLAAVGVEDLNLALRRSKVAGTVRLVDCVTLTNPVPEAASPTANTDVLLPTLTYGNDAWAVEARGLREEHHADLVCLLVGGSPTNGAAYVPTDATDDDAFAYCVVYHRSVAVGYQLAHEVGHCFGCCHQASDAGTCANGSVTYCHGFHFSVRTPDRGLVAYRTVMATIGEVSSQRVLNFSNPKVSYGGFGGPPTGDAMTADNARRLREMMPGVARYRSQPP